MDVISRVLAFTVLLVLELPFQRIDLVKELLEALLASGVSLELESALKADSDEQLQIMSEASNKCQKILGNS